MRTLLSLICQCSRRQAAATPLIHSVVYISTYLSCLAASSHRLFVLCPPLVRPIIVFELVFVGRIRCYLPSSFYGVYLNLFTLGKFTCLNDVLILFAIPQRKIHAILRRCEMLLLASEWSAFRINSVSQTCCVLLSLSVYRGQEVAAVSLTRQYFVHLAPQLLIYAVFNHLPCAQSM